jgi:hypothetical protein
VRSSHLADGAWWETSDRARPLDAGFTLHGRADRIVKIEEKRVSLTAVETAATETGYLAEARALVVGERLALVGVPSEAGWQMLRRAGKRGLNEALRERLVRRIERVALPRRFRYVAELPANSQGKATAALLGALFDDGMPAFEWRLREPDRAELALDVRPGLRVFDGHFPEVPVLPGVAQVDWAVAFARECFALPPRFVRAEALKFHVPVVPPAQVVLSLEWSRQAGQLSFRYASPAGAHSTGRLMFGARDV